MTVPPSPDKSTFVCLFYSAHVLTSVCAWNHDRLESPPPPRRPPQLVLYRLQDVIVIGVFSVDCSGSSIFVIHGGSPLSWALLREHVFPVRIFLGCSFRGRAVRAFRFSYFLRLHNPSFLFPLSSAARAASYPPPPLWQWLSDVWPPSAVHSKMFFPDLLPEHGPPALAAMQDPKRTSIFTDTPPSPPLRCFSL